MGKKASPETLYKLVKSLSPMEKAMLQAYSVVYGKRGGDYSLVWKLIDFLYNEPHYDAAQLRGAFKGKDLATLKKDARKWLFKAMYRLGLRRNFELHDLVGSAVVAIERRDPVGANRIIREAKSLCEKRELFLVHLELLLHELKIMPDTLKGQELKDHLAINSRETESVQRLFSNHMAYIRLNKHYLIPAREQYQRTGQWDFTEIRKLEEEQLMHDEKNALTLRARIEFHDAWLLIHTANQDWKNCANSSEQIVSIFKQSKWLQEELYERFLDAMNFYAHFCNILRQKKESRNQLDHLQSLIESQRNANVNTFLLSRVISLKFSYADIYKEVSEAREALELARKYEKELEFWEKPLNLLRIYFMALRFIINSGPKEDVYAMVSKVLQFRSSGYQGYYQMYARLLHLTYLLDEMIAGDESKRDILESFGRNYARYAKKYALQFPVCERVVCFLKEAAKYFEKGILKAKLISLQHEISELLPSDKMTSHFFQFEEWVKRIIADLD